MASESTPPPSFVKQAMRNMVRKGSKSLFHFGLTAMGFLGFITLVAWLGPVSYTHLTLPTKASV